MLDLPGIVGEFDVITLRGQRYTAALSKDFIKRRFQECHGV